MAQSVADILLVLPRKSSSLTTLRMLVAAGKTLSRYKSFSYQRHPQHTCSFLSNMAAISRNSLRAFLRQAKVNLQSAIEKKERVTLVIGNESAG